jgi:hypothetical protein
MYHLDVSKGESPDFATVKVTPLELYVGLPVATKLSELPLVKSMLTDFPSAVSAGQEPWVRGLQELEVWAVIELISRAALVAAAIHWRIPFMLSVCEESCWLVDEERSPRGCDSQEEKDDYLQRSNSKCMNRK